MKLELTEKEAQSLLEIIDIALKSNGIQVAKTAVVLIEKILEAAQKESE